MIKILLFVLLLSGVAWGHEEECKPANSKPCPLGTYLTHRDNIWLCCQVITGGALDVKKPDTYYGGSLLGSSCDCPKIRKDTRWVKVENRTIIGYKDNCPVCGNNCIYTVICEPTPIYSDNDTWRKETCLTDGTHRWACKYSEPQRRKNGNSN